MDKLDNSCWNCGVEKNENNLQLVELKEKKYTLCDLCLEMLLDALELNNN